MANPRKGVRVGVSPARRMVVELLHHARKVPSLSDGQIMNVAELAAARTWGLSHSWPALFMKAYGLVAQKFPELRRAYIPWPFPHFYEHPSSECAILIEREWQGELVVMGGRIRCPENQSLDYIDAQLRYFREAPVLEVNYFRKILKLGSLPGFLRRFTFWHSLYLSGFKRAKRFGTFMMSSLGNFGVEQYHPLTPLTTYFTYGPISSKGDVEAKIIYDHRVMDARTVARCLNELEKVLKTDMVQELRNGSQFPINRGESASHAA